jgi:hypothetical protein
MILFDYIWLRVARFYYKWRDSEGFTATGFLSLSQGILIGDIIQVIVKLTGDSDSFYRSSGMGKIELVITLALLAFNYFHYRKKYWPLRERWRNESYPFLKGVLVVLALLFPFVLWYMLVEVF